MIFYSFKCKKEYIPHFQKTFQQKSFCLQWNNINDEATFQIYRERHTLWLIHNCFTCYLCKLLLQKPLICSVQFHKLLKYLLYVFLLFMRYSTVWATSKISTQKYLLGQGLYNECITMVTIAGIIRRYRVISLKTCFLLIL